MLPDERQAARVLLRPAAITPRPCSTNWPAAADGRRAQRSGRVPARAHRARAGAGSFVPDSVSAWRPRAQRQKAALRREREAEERRLAAERATPEYQARARAQREKVRQMLGELKTRMNTGRQP